MPLHGTTSISFLPPGVLFQISPALALEQTLGDSTVLMIWYYFAGQDSLSKPLCIHISISMAYTSHPTYIYIYYIICIHILYVYYICILCNIIICTIQTRSAIFVNLACIVTLSGSALCTIQLHRSTVRFKQRTAVPNCLPLKCEHPRKSRSTVSALLFNQAIDKPCCQTENCQRLKEHWNHQGFLR